ncbi:VanZ family protein [Ramlibacter sp.]|uniref:VanZ family protein n=1 Tax=Ramlibacter sp. TaxID=1917967 RepID=UPI002603B4AC|nr:VanZ family protein [Ramlibacter sp.]
MTSTRPSPVQWATFVSLLVLLFAGILMPGALKSDIEHRMWHVLPWAHLAHFTLFALIASCPVYGSGRPAVVRAIALAALLAVVTELLQNFIPGRHPTIRDCFIDLTGTLAGLAARRMFDPRYR